MPKHLITIIGLIVSLGIVALGVAVVAVPLWAQSLAVDAQTVTVENTNQLYQAQVDSLETEKERQGEIEASVAVLREEIPAADQFDDVFEVVSRAAESAGVTITSVTAGDNADFAVRTTPSLPGDVLVPESPQAEQPQDDGDADGSGASEAADGTDTASDSSTGTGTSETPDPGALQGRQQVDFEIAVNANDMAQVPAFLDGLRSGPRLLSSITATATQTGTAIEVQVSALTFIDPEG